MCCTKELTVSCVECIPGESRFSAALCNALIVAATEQFSVFFCQLIAEACSLILTRCWSTFFAQREVGRKPSVSIEFNSTTARRLAW